MSSALNIGSTATGLGYPSRLLSGTAQRFPTSQNKTSCQPAAYPYRIAPTSTNRTRSAYRALLVGSEKRFEKMADQATSAPADATVLNTTVASVPEEENKKVTQSARVVLPTAADQDTDEEAEDEEHEAADNGDFLDVFPDDTEELELMHLRIGSLEPLHLDRFKNALKKLCLRQNFISHLDPATFHQLTHLEELDLYDNKLKTIGDVLVKSPKLTVLDLSFNLLRSVPDGLDTLPVLDTIYFVQNKIHKITGFTSCTTLRSLELGGNKIRKIENLESLVNLEELWLGKNKITKLEGLATLKKLKILSLQSNRITKLEGLEELRELNQLYLSHNGVEKLEGLENNLELTTLDVGNNFIPAIENISHLKKLEELWMNGNKVPDLRALDTELKDIPTLMTLYLEANPCQINDMTGYRRKIMLALPQLQQIDATYTRRAA